MNAQHSLPGTRPMSTTIPPKRMPSLMLNIGGQGALKDVKERLEAMQKQHPSAVGITLALSVIERDLANPLAARTGSGLGRQRRRFDAVPPQMNRRLLARGACRDAAFDRQHRHLVSGP